MCIIICDEKNHLIIIQWLKICFLNMEVKGERFKSFHLHFRLVGKVFRWARF
jgi:hypothetical protein